MKKRSDLISGLDL